MKSTINSSKLQTVSILHNDFIMVFYGLSPVYVSETGRKVDLCVLRNLLCFKFSAVTDAEIGSVLIEP